MANCVVQELTVDQLKDAIRAKKPAIQIPYDQSQTAEQTYEHLVDTQNMVSKVEVKAEELPDYIRHRLPVDEGDLVERYGFQETGEVMTWRRVTDRTAQQFLRKMGKERAKEINKTLDNITKANIGTKVHYVGENVLHHLIETDTSGLIFKNSTNPKYKIPELTLAQIKKNSELSDTHFNRIVEGIKDIVTDIKAIQKKIDPKGKVRILPEQILVDPVADETGTADILTIFSDNTGGIIDFKTINPHHDKRAWDNAVRGYQLKEENWIPTYKMEDFNIQIPRLADIAMQRYGIKQMRMSRVVPIHVELKVLPKHLRQEGQFFKPELDYIAFPIRHSKPHDPKLTAIPIAEFTGIKDLDKAIGSLAALKHNKELEIEKLDRGNPRYDVLAADIQRKQIAINRLIIERDVRTMYNDIFTLNKRYVDKVGKLKDIDSEFIDGKPNPDYVSMSDLQDLLREFQSYQQILNVSGEFLAELGITDPKLQQSYMKRKNYLAGQISSVIKDLKSIYLNRAMTKSQRISLQSAKEMGPWASLFRSAGDQANPAIRAFMERVQTAQNLRRIAEQRIEKEIIAEGRLLEEWARKKGISGFDIYDRLIDKRTGNLHSKYSTEFFTDLRTAQKEGDAEWAKQFLRRRQDAKTRYDRNFEIFKNRQPDDRDIENWKRRHKIEDAWKDNKLWSVYYEINPDIKTDSKYYSEGFSMLNQTGNEGLLRYWEFWQRRMGEALDMLDLSKNERLHNNFLPWIRADMVNQLLQDGWNWENIRNTAESIFKIKEDETLFGDLTIEGKIDPLTNEPVRDVPRFFINELKDNKGRINIGLKSKDLGKSLFVFYSMATNYKYMKHHVEPYAEAIKDVLAYEGVEHIKNKGKKVKLASGIYQRITGEKLDAVKLLDQYIQYHLYGVKIQDKQTNTTKTLLSLKSFQSMKELAFSPLLWIGNFIQIKTNSYFEGLKGYYYTTAQMNQAHKMASGMAGTDMRNIYNGLVYFFEPSPGRKDIKAKNLSISNIIKHANTHTAFVGMRKAEENVNNTVMAATLQNYGFDENGNIKRLANLPKGTKSLLDLVQIKDGQLTMENVVDVNGEVNIENYTKIRNLVMGIAKGVKGQLNHEDMFAANMSLLGNLMMAFKSWMPGMLDERFSEIRYDPLTDTIKQGKYVAYFNEMSREQKGILEFLGNVVVPNLGKLALDIATFGWLFKHGLRYKVNEQRARQLFEKFKADNIYDTDVQRMEFKDFLEYKQGQIRSLAAELSVILAFVSSLMFLGSDWDDDGEAFYKKTWANRTLFRMVNRARRELAFAISPDDWTTLFRTPIPLTGLVVDLQRWLSNTLDETGDILWGEDVERAYLKGMVFGRNRGKDRRPIGYETLRWLPGHKFIKMLEAFDIWEEAEM